MTELTAPETAEVFERARAAARLRRVQSELRLIRSFARREVHSRYRQSSLSLLWAIVQPVALVAVYGVVFSQILQVDGGGLPYLPFIIAGLAPWRFVQGAMSQATCFIDRSDTLTKVYFRREVLPLAGCVAALIDLAVGLIALLVVALVQGLPPTVTLLALPLVLAVLLTYSCAFAVILSTVTVFIRDLAHVMPTANQVLFLISPIMYSQTLLPPGLTFLATVNPVAVVIEALRDITLRAVWPNFGLLSVHLVIGIALFVGSIFYLRSIEDRIVDVV